MALNPGQELLAVVTKAAEGTRKDGFTTGGVTLTVNPGADTVTFTGTVPVSFVSDPANGSMIITAKDFLEYGAAAPVTPPVTP